MNRVLACDLDGVIFKFNDSYAKLFKKFGLDFPPETNEFPTDWFWERSEGATKEQENQVWDWINGPEGSYQFWRHLPAYAGAQEFLTEAYQTFNDVWFITARSGKHAKQATEDALKALEIPFPQVIIAKDKVPQLIGVGATDFLDDRDKNFNDVLTWGTGLADTLHVSHDRKVTETGGDVAMDLGIKLWMLDRPWNRDFNDSRVKRIQSPMELLRA